MQGAGPHTKTGNTVKRTGATRSRGHHSTHLSRHSIRPPSKQQGGATTQREGQRCSTHPSLTMPPTIHYATPPSTMATPPPQRRGGQIEDTPPHEDLGEIVTRTAPHTRQGTVRDMTVQYSRHALSRAGRRQHTLDRAGQQHAPPPFHTPHTRRMDTIHSVSPHTVHVHTTNERS